MPDIAILIITTLISVGIGAFIRDYFTKRTEKRKAKERILQFYLLQLQDAVESLWHRLNNIKNRGGLAVMEDQYFEVSTLYVLGRVLAYERILLLDGIYSQLNEIKPELGKFLKESITRVDEKFSSRKFQRYNRLALAESVIERGVSHLKTKNFIDFKKEYEIKNSILVDFLEPARSYIASFEIGDPGFSDMLSDLSHISFKLSDETNIKSSL